MESQLSPAGIGEDGDDEDGGRGCGIGGVWPDLRACSSHASRDLWSMGQTSADVDAGADVVALCDGDCGTHTRSTLALAPIIEIEAQWSNAIVNSSS